MTDEQPESRNPELARFFAWFAVGVLFMVGCIAPVGFLLWIPAAVVAAVLTTVGVRSPRYFFAFVTGLGATLIGLGIINGTYTVMIFFGCIVIGGGIVFYASFGPRTSHADPPTGT